MTLLLAVAVVLGAESDVDVELLRARHGRDSFGGADSVDTLPPGRARVLGLAQYEAEPVVYYLEHAYAGAAVGERVQGSVGVGLGATRWLDFGLVLPGYLTYSSDALAYTADGPALGDLATTARVGLARGPRGGFLLRADVYWPTGSRDAWTSEAYVRPALAAVGTLRTGRLASTVDLGLLARPARTTDLHYTPSTELTTSLHLGLDIVPERLVLDYALLGRLGLASPESLSSRPSEMLVGLTGHPGRGVDVVVGGGLGLSGGVGAATYRAFSELRWLVGERARPVEAVVATGEGLVDAEEPEPEPRVAVVVEPVPTWTEGQLARVDDEEIAIREPIQFEFAKDVILPQSRPTLSAVAHLLRTDGRILHVVVAGHASEEGSFIYNYDLSARRARAVWEALVAAGVHPDRISYTGMGEVEPTRPGAAEGDLAANRRVVFRIVRLLAPGEGAPALPDHIVIPWSGEPGTAVTPAPPPPPPPPTEEEEEL